MGTGVLRQSWGACRAPEDTQGSALGTWSQLLHPQVQVHGKY